MLDVDSVMDTVFGRVYNTSMGINYQTVASVSDVVAMKDDKPGLSAAPEICDASPGVCDYIIFRKKKSNLFF